MHTYTISLRIVGKDLQPQEVTSTLGLEAAVAHEANEPRGRRGRVFEQGMWAYEGDPEEAPAEWVSLEEGLVYLIEKLTPLRDKIRGYMQQHRVYWWCGHFFPYSDFGGGPVLSATTLKLLADFGIDLILDTYGHAEEAK